MGIQLLGSPQLVGRGFCDRGTRSQRDIIMRFLMYKTLLSTSFQIHYRSRDIVDQFSPKVFVPLLKTYLRRSSVKQRLRSLSVYLLQASTARGFDRTVVIETDPTFSTLCFCISLKMYTPVNSFPWVPPQMAKLDSGGKETHSICQHRGKKETFR